MRTVKELVQAHGRRLAWGLFAVECAALLVYAIAVAASHPSPVADGATRADRMRFGKSEAERKRIFQDLVAGENADRLAVAGESDTAVWNRNRDDYFHQREERRLGGVASRHRIPAWQAWLIVDEGLRAHWPPPPGVEIRQDDAPLARTTRPIAQHPILVATPAAPPPPPPPRPFGPEWPPTPPPKKR